MCDTSNQTMQKLTYDILPTIAVQNVIQNHERYSESSKCSKYNIIHAVLTYMFGDAGLTHRVSVKLGNSTDGGGRK